MFLKTCALIALIAFAQIVRAQEDDMDFKEKSEKKQDDDLEERGGAYGKWNKGRSFSRGHGSSGYRGNGNGLGFSGAGFGGNGGGRGLGNNVEGIEVAIANQRETNKVVPGIVEVAPTVVTNSNSVRVIGNTRTNNLQQNSQSTVVQNNVVKSTDVHVHTDTLVKQPKVVNKFIRRHRTKYIIRTQPVKTNVNIERKQEIIRPEVKNIVIYQNTESLRRQRLPTIVRNRQKFEQLQTIREPTRNDGTEVIGNPANAGSTSGSLASGFNGGISNGFGSNRGLNGGFSNGFGSNRGGHGSFSSFGKSRGGSRHGGKYNNIYGRSNEAVQEEEEKVAPEETKVEVEAAEEPTH